jgi:hypothetical protein
VSFTKGVRAIVPYEVRSVELRDPVKVAPVQITSVISRTNLLFCSLTSSSGQSTADRCKLKLGFELSPSPTWFISR